MSTPNFSIEGTPEFIAAQDAAKALQKRQDELDRARAEHESREAKRAALAATVDTLRSRRARGLLEIETIERLAASKADQLGATFGVEGIQPGLVPKLAGEIVELNSTATHLRKRILTAIETEISNAEKALAEFEASKVP